jgi:hypothetical protein
LSALKNDKPTGSYSWWIGFIVVIEVILEDKRRSRAREVLALRRVAALCGAC